MYVRPLNVNDPEELERHARNVPPARWQRVLQHLETRVGPEEPFSPVILKTCGTSQKIQVSLKMLIRKGLIRKVSTGVYVRLVKIPEPVAGPAREHR